MLLFSHSVMSDSVTLMDCSMPGLLVLHHLPELTQTHFHWVSEAIQPSHPLSSPVLLPAIFPSIRVFSNESTLRIRWPKYWNFSFRISLSNEIIFMDTWYNQVCSANYHPKIWIDGWTLGVTDKICLFGAEAIGNINW